MTTGSTRLIRWGTLVAVLALAAMLVAGCGGRKVAVPAIVGDAQEAAAAELSASGLIVGTVTPVPGAGIPGTVTAQEPQAGAEVEEGSAVNVQVIAASGSTSVPAVIGTSQAEAENVVKLAGLQVGDLRQAPSPQPKNTVLRQYPNAGTAVEKGSAVDLVLSSGTMEVPNVVGMKLAEAQATLSDATYTSTVGYTNVPAGDPRDGTVLSQSVPPGTDLPTGSAVALSVAKAAAGPTPTVTVTATATVTAAPTVTVTKTVTASPTAPPAS